MVKAPCFGSCFSSHFAVPHPSRLPPGHLPPGGRVCGVPRILHGVLRPPMPALAEEEPPGHHPGSAGGEFSPRAQRPARRAEIPAESLPVQFYGRAGLHRLPLLTTCAILWACRTSSPTASPTGRPPPAASFAASCGGVPDFIAYRFSHRQTTPSCQLCRKLWKAQGVSWTLKTQAEYDTAKAEGWLPIFEGFRP